MKNNDKKIRMQDIAELANVSSMTVSKVLNAAPGTRIKVGAAKIVEIRKLAAELGYRPNRAASMLAGRNSGLIGVVIDSCAPVLYRDMLSPLEQSIAKHGYGMLVLQAHDDPEKIKNYAAILSSYNVDGIICMAHSYPNITDEIMRYYDSSASTVFFHRYSAMDEFYCVNLDPEDQYMQAIKHLAASGKKRIGILTYQASRQGVLNLDPEVRVEKYRQALARHQLAMDDKLIARIPRQEMENGRTVANGLQQLIEAGADAFLLTELIHCAIAYRLLVRRKLSVPHDIGIVLCQYAADAALLAPGVTTAAPEINTAADLLADLLMRRLNQEDIPSSSRHCLIPNKLTVRQSSDPTAEDIFFNH